MNGGRPPGLLLAVAGAGLMLGCGGPPVPAAAPPAESTPAVDLVAASARARVRREIGRIDVGTPLLARRRPAGVLAAAQGTPDDELAERLRALGYLD